MFDLISKIVQFLFQAVVVYAASEEGATQLRSVLNEAERSGIDVPFYEPSNVDGSAGESSSSDNLSSEESADYSATVNPTRKVYPKVQE